jgi:hypothetical protein
MLNFAIFTWCTDLCVSTESREGNVRCNRNGSSTFSSQKEVQMIEMVIGKMEPLMKFQICL